MDTLSDYTIHLRIDKETEKLIEDARRSGLVDNLSDLVRRSVREYLYCAINIPEDRGLFLDIVLHPFIYAKKSKFVDKLRQLVHDGASPSLIAEIISQEVKPDV